MQAKAKATSQMSRCLCVNLTGLELGVKANARQFDEAMHYMKWFEERVEMKLRQNLLTRTLEHDQTRQQPVGARFGVGKWARIQVTEW